MMQRVALPRGGGALLQGHVWRQSGRLIPGARHVGHWRIDVPAAHKVFAIPLFWQLLKACPSLY